MDPYSARPTPQPENQLSHRISNLSEITDYETYDGYHEPAQSALPLNGRPSLVSLQSSYRASPALPEHTSPARQSPNASAWSMPFSGYSGAGASAYEPVPVSGEGHDPAHQRSRNFGRLASLRTQHEIIVEEPEGIRESIDMTTLVNHGAPMGTSSPYSPLARDDVEEQGMPFDVTGFLGPATTQDEAFIKKLQEQEASGKLTGGLGVGFGAGTKLKESDLLTPGTPVITPLGRQSTVKVLAQNEANKRGEIVEVIIEEPAAMASEVDLSVVAGPATVEPHGRRRSTIPMARQRTEIFYPQPNWKPFSMKWPYLLLLIVLSIGYAATQELAYPISAPNALLVFHSPSDIPGAQYFAYKFAPNIISVGFGVLWQITDFEVKRLEAFYQLSKDRGALADESINVDYITHFSFLRPFRALYCKHYAVVVSSVASLLAVSLVPTLSTASIVLNPDRTARLTDPDGEKSITIHPVWSRLLTATLCIIALLGCILFWLLQSRRSGLQADVKGIAGLASMAVVSHILMDFKDMDVATHKDIHHKLKDHRYVLRNNSLAPDDEIPISKQEIERYKENHLSQNPHPLMLRPAGMAPFIIGIGLFAAFLPIFLFTNANVLTDKAPWVATALAVCIKLSWGSLETSVRMMEPYYILSRRNAPPKTLTLDYTAVPFGWVAVQALFNRHLLVFFVGFGTVMTEVLTVLVTALASVDGNAFATALASNSDGNDKQIDSGQETPASFWVSLFLVLFILLYMATVAVVVFVRRRQPFLPRQPNTIASVLAFIHQSKMLYDFVGTSKFTNAEMVHKLQGLKKTYGLGWFEGRDGQTHCGVDQEELMSSYKLGYDYSRSNKPWVDRPVEWL